MRREFDLGGQLNASADQPDATAGTSARPMRNPLTISKCSRSWAFVITKAMIAIGIGAMALFIAGACAFAHRHALKPL
jgi:hypothetical protein